jgi:hypothetical protein
MNIPSHINDGPQLVGCVGVPWCKLLLNVVEIDELGHGEGRSSREGWFRCSEYFFSRWDKEGKADFQAVRFAEFDETLVTKTEVQHPTSYTLPPVCL